LENIKEGAKVTNTVMLSYEYIMLSFSESPMLWVFNYYTKLVESCVSILDDSYPSSGGTITMKESFMSSLFSKLKKTNSITSQNIELLYKLRDGRVLVVTN